MKVLISGNCVAPTMAKLVAIMSPQVAVECFAADVDIAGVAATDDVIFRQRSPRFAWSLRPPRSNEFLFPRIWFNAFHPDAVYVRGPAGWVETPLSHYNSSLAFYGWLRGMSVAQTARLFREPVYERLGFFTYWEATKRGLFEEAEKVGFSLDDLFTRWQRRGRFMYSPNHPVLAVIADVTRTLVRRAGLPVAFETPEDVLDDALLEGPVWPVYPELGGRLGIPGGTYSFKRAHARPEIPVLLDLEAFIAASFETYARFAPGELSCERLETPAYRELEAGPAATAKPSNGAPHAAARSAEPYAGESRNIDLLCDEDALAQAIASERAR